MPFNKIIIRLVKECNQIRFTLSRSSVPSVVEYVNIVIDCRGRRQFRKAEKTGKYLYFLMSAAARYGCVQLI